MMERDNLALCIGKQGNAIGNSEWSLVYISEIVVALSRTSKLMKEIDQEIEFTRALYQDAT